MPESVFSFRFESDKALSSLSKLESTSKGVENSLDSLDGASKKTSGDLNKLGGSASKVSQDFDSIAKSSLAAKVSIVALGAAAASAVSTFVRFDDAIRKVAAVSGATGKELDSLRAIALKMGSETKFSASEAAEGLGFLAMAGFSAAESISALPSVLQLAAAGGIALGEAADIATNIMSGFGIATEDLAKSNDVLTATFTNSNTSLQELGAAFQVVGPLASAAGLSFNDVALEIGLLGNAGIKASLAGTGLAGAMAQLLKPTKEVTDTLKRLNVDILNTDGSMRGFRLILEDLAKAGANTNDILTIFGREAGPKMQALLNASSESVDKLKTAIAESGGVTAKTSKTMSEGLGGSLRSLASASEGLAIAFGAEIAPALKLVVDAATGAIRVLTDLGAVIKGVVIVAMAALIGHTTRLAVALGTTLFAAATAAITVTRTLGAAMGLLGGPAGVIALVALSAFELASAYETQSDRAKLASEAANQHAATLNSMVTQVNAAKLSVDGLTNSLLNQAKAQLVLAKASVQQQETAVALAKDTIEYEKALNDGTASLLEYGDAGVQVNETIQKQEEVIKNAEATIFELSVGIDAMEAALSDAEGSMGNLGKATDTTVPPMKNLTKATDDADKSLKKAKKSAEDLPLSLSKLEASIRKLAAPYREAAKAEEEAFKKMADDARAFDQEVNDISNRIAGSLADIFVDFLEGGANAFDTLLSLFKRMLAEMLATALANPIKLVIGGILGGGGVGSAAAAGLGGVGGIGSGGADLLNLASGANSLLGGGLTSAFLVGGANVLAGLGATGLATGLATSGSLIGTAGFVGAAPATFAAAGGYLAAGGYMAALGAVAPYLAAIVAIAAAFGLFGSDPKSKGKIFGNLTPEGFQQTEFLDQHFIIQPFQNAIQGITDTTSAVLNAIGGVNQGQFVGIKQSESGITGLVGPPGGGEFSLIGRVDPEDAEGVQDLFAQMTLAAVAQADLSEVAAPLTAFLGQMTEEAIEQLGSDDIQGILNWLVSIGEAASVAGETFEGIAMLIEGFEGPPDQLIAYSNALITIGAALSTSPLEDYQAALEAANQTITDSVRDAHREVVQLALAYDGSTGATVALAQAVTTYKELAIQAAAAIDQAMSFVSSSIENTIQQIQFNLLNEEEQYEFLTTQAEQLAAAISSMTDPAQIAQTVQQINQLVSQAYGSLSEELQAQVAPGFIAFLESVQSTATEQLEALQEGLDIQFDNLTEMIDFSLLEAAGAQINEAAQLQAQASQNMQSAAMQMQSAAAQQSAAAGSLAAAVASIPARITVQSTIIGAEIGGR